MKALPSSSGPVFVKMADYADKIFEMDVAISKVAPVVLPFINKEEIVNFIEIKRKAKTFIYNNQKGKSVGFLSLVDSPDKEKRAELLALMILPQYWKQGFGRKMVNHCHRLMRKKGFKKSKLLTSPKNIQAIAFYLKLGYIKQKIIKNYYGPGEDRLLMVYNLQ